jgi:hypothetical protein
MGNVLYTVAEPSRIMVQVLPFTFEVNSMKKTYAKFVLGLLAAVYCFLPSLVLAQDMPSPLAEEWMLVPKAGQASALAQALKEHKAFRSEHGDPRQWEIYTPFLGDDLGRFAVRSCCTTWAEVEAYREWAGNAKEIMDHYGEHVEPLVENHAHYFDEIDWANSHWDSEGGPYRYFEVTAFSVKPGLGADFNAAREKMSQIAINQGWAAGGRSWLWASTIGGEPITSIIVPRKNLASMAHDGENFAGFLARQMGSEEAAADLMKKFSASTTSTDYQIWVLED